MEDHTKDMSKLYGNPAEARKSSTLERVIDIYAAWVQTVAVTSPNEEGEQLYHEVTEVQKDINARLRGLPVTKKDIPSFLTTLQEFKTQPGYRHSGLFVSELLKKAGRGYYQLSGVEDLHWIGTGLEGFVLQAETFGRYAGSFSSYTTCKTKMPVRCPKKGVVLVGQHFTDYTGYGTKNLQIHGSTFGSNIGKFANRMIILNGQFDSGAGTNAGQMVVCGGTFNGWVGDRALEVTIVNGVFNSMPLGLPLFAYIHGGDFAEESWKGKNDRSLRQLCGESEAYTANGKTRYKVTPWPGFEKPIERMMRMLRAMIPPNLMALFPELEAELEDEGGFDTED